MKGCYFRGRRRSGEGRNHGSISIHGNFKHVLQRSVLTSQRRYKAEAKKAEADKKPEEAKVDLPMTEPTEKDSAEKTKKKTIRRNLVTSPPKINQQ